MMFRADDIFAAVILSIVMLRRLEAQSQQEADHPSVPGVEFQRWRHMALTGYNLAAVACLAKIVGSQLWLYLFHAKPVLLMIGGASIFIGWVIAIVVAWRHLTEARVLRGVLGIVRQADKRK
jgi:hypothetical protein